MDNKKILFVCLGNICRSPAAEGIMKSLVNKNGLNKSITVDSAGTIGYHTGDTPDPRMISHAAKRGYQLNHKARKFDPLKDFDKFDYIITMDDSNFSDINALDKGSKHKQKIYKMVNFAKNYDVDEVPDPYYLGPEGFENVLDVLEDGCNGLLEHVTNGS